MTFTVVYIIEYFQLDILEVLVVYANERVEYNDCDVPFPCMEKKGYMYIYVRERLYNNIV